MTVNIVPYDGLGFLIHLVNPPLITLPDGTEIPAPNMRTLQRAVFLLLIEKPARLTGAEVRFVRKYLRLKQVELASLLHLSNHSAVSQWETREDEPAGMDYNTEILLRLRMSAAVSENKNLPWSLLDKWNDLTLKDDTWKIQVAA